MATDGEYLAAAGAFTNAAATVTAANMGKRSRKAYYKYLREAEERADQRSLRNWNMQNEYNSPVAQMARYKEAGLNPNLIYGQANTTGLPASVESADPGWNSADSGVNGFEAAANAISAYQQIRSRQIANQNAEVVGQLTGLKAANEEKKGTAMDIQNKILADTADYQVQSMALKVGSQQFAHAYNWKVKMQQGLNDLEKQKEELVGLRHKNKKTLKEIDAIDVSMNLMRKQIEVADKQMDQITQNMDIQAERRPWEIKSIQAGIGYQRQMTANAATQGKIYQKDFDWYDEMAQNRFDKEYYSGPNVWNLPGMLFKHIHKEYAGFAKKYNLP